MLWGGSLIAFAQSGDPVAWGDNRAGQTNVPAALSNTVALAAGTRHSLALQDDGAVLAWGSSTEGQTNVPANLRNVVAISAGGDQSLALTAEGLVVAWGAKTCGQDLPAGLSNVVALAAANDHCLALQENGQVVAWGCRNRVPTGLSNVVAVAAGAYDLALASDGTLTAWDAEGNRLTPPASLTKVVAVANGPGHMLAVTTAGRVVGWFYGTGSANYGQAYPPTGLSNVVEVAVGYSHSLALRDDGTMVAWGRSPYGQANVPEGLTNLALVAAGDNHSLALPATISRLPHTSWARRTVYSGKTIRLDARAIGGFPLAFQWQAEGVDLAGATNSTLVLTNLQTGDRGLYSVVVSNAWGTATANRLDLTVVEQAPFFIAQPLPQTSAMARPVTWQVETDGSWPLTYQWYRADQPLAGATLPTLVLSNVLLEESGLYSVAVSNPLGRLASSNAALTVLPLAAWDSDGTPLFVPLDLTNATTIAAGSTHFLALRDDHTVTAWAPGGYPGSGETNVPAGLTNVTALAAGSAHSLALVADGTVVAWGRGTTGQNKVPAGLSRVVAIAEGAMHSLVAQADGTVVAWGDNAYGQTNVPPGLSGVVAVAAGQEHSLALKQDGTVVAWGHNDRGQTNVPPGLDRVVAIAASYDFSLALRTDGSVAAWGYSGYGQTHLPAGLSNVVALSAGYAHCLAARSDGSVLNWGGATLVPAALSHIKTVAASYWGSLALAATHPPRITRPPRDQSALLLGDQASFDAAVEGAPPLACQWWLNGAPLAGATHPTLVLTNVQAADLGAYQLQVSNVFGSVTSDLVHLAGFFAAEQPNVTTWTPAQHPPVVDRPLTIAQGQTLRIAPGTVVKFATGVALNVAGSLDVRGHPDNPVVFTSWHEDLSGGAPAGPNQLPAPGDWHGVVLTAPGAVGQLEGATIQYASHALELAAGSGIVHLHQVILRHNEVGIRSLSASNQVELETCLLSENQSALSLANSTALVLRNVTLAGNEAAGNLGRGPVLIENSIIAFNGSALGATPTPALQSSNSLYFSPEGPVREWLGQAAFLLGHNQNADPWFEVSPASDYELAAGSPAIDAGRGARATQTDLLGRPLHDDERHADTGSGEVSYLDLGAFERQEDSALVDLAVASVSSPIPQAVGSNGHFTFTWTVGQLGPLDTTGMSWVDVAYLATTPYPSPEMIELARHTNELVLPPGSNYDHTVTVPAPPGANGLYYVLVRVNATGSVREATQDNNVALAPLPVAINVPRLGVGSPLSGSVSNGVWTYLCLNAGAGATVLVNVATLAVGGSLKVYARFGTLPTAAAYDAIAAVAGANHQTLRLHSPVPGLYYLGLFAENLPGGSAALTGSVASAALTLRGVTPAVVGNAGQATLRIEGDRFTPTAQFRLTAAGHSPLESTEYYVDGGTVFATFDLSGAGAAAGLYDLEVSDAAAGPTLLPGAVIVVDGGAPAPQVNLQLPASTRPQQVVTARLRFENRGQLDLPSPWLTLLGPVDCAWQLPGSSVWHTGPMVALIGLSRSGPANLLRPGQSEEVEVRLQTPREEGRASFQVGVRTALPDDASGGPVEWSNWSKDPALVTVLRNTFGATWCEYIQALARVGANLALLGQTRYAAVDLERAALRAPALAQRPIASSPAAWLEMGPSAPTSLASQGVHVYAWSDAVWNPIPLPATLVDRTRQTVLLLHGTSSSIAEPWVAEMACALTVSRPEVKNILAADWGEYAQGAPPAATARFLPSVASRLFTDLRAAGVPAARLHLIGHDHGAHLAGLIAEHFRLAGTPVARLTALDASAERPAGPDTDPWVPAWGRSLGSAIYLDSYRSSPLVGEAAIRGDDHFLLVRPGETWGSLGYFSRLTDLTSYSYEWFTRTIWSSEQNPLRLGYAWGPGSWLGVVRTRPDRIAGPTSPWKGLIRSEEGGRTVLECLAADTDDQPGGRWRYPGGWTDLEAGLEDALARAVELAPTNLSLTDWPGENPVLPAGGQARLSYQVANRADNLGFHRSERSRAQTGRSTPAAPGPAGLFQGGLQDLVFLSTNAVLDAGHAFFLSAVTHEDFIEARSSGDFSAILRLPNAQAIRAKWNLASLEEVSYFLIVKTGGGPDDLDPANDTNALPIHILGEALSAQAGGNHEYRQICQGEWAAYPEPSSDGEWIRWHTEARYPEATLQVVFAGGSSASPGRRIVAQWSDGGGTNLTLLLSRTVTTDREEIVRTLTVTDLESGQTASDTATNTVLRVRLPPIGPRPADLWVRHSTAPRDKIGPAGADAPEATVARRFIAPGQSMAYRLEMLQPPEALLPAHSLECFDRLDTNVFDTASFAFTRGGFLQWDLPLGEGQAAEQVVDARPTLDARVRFTAQFDPTTGRLDWQVVGLDPLTGLIPDDPLRGFLPPLDTNGQPAPAWLEYRVRLKTGLPSGTVLSNRAWGRLDQAGAYAPMPSAGPWLNTVDAATPASQVLALPATSSETQLVVRWSGQDEPNGSGVAGFDLYVRDNDGAWTLWQTNTTNRFANFTGLQGHRYAFYSLARDRVGHLEPPPAAPDAVTTFGTLFDLSFNLFPTYNLVSVPFTGTDLTNAESLLRAIPSCSGLWKWDAALQGWSGHRPAGPNNFAVPLPPAH